jgi:hypothetical protein
LEEKIARFFWDRAVRERPQGMRCLPALGAALREVSDWEIEASNFRWWYFHRGCTGNAERRKDFNRKKKKKNTKRTKIKS